MRSWITLVITLFALSGSVITALATTDQRNTQLRGYVDPTKNADLPFRVPRLGVNVELTQYDDAELAENLTMMQAGGVVWVRQFFYWDDIEPARGEQDWTEADRIVEAIAQARGLRLVAVLMNAPAWASGDDDPTTPPADPADFAAFAAAFAERYGATVDQYQVWDEPNLREAWGMENPRAPQYAALLSAAYSVIHSNDPSATVLAAALAPTTETGPLNISDWRYLDDLYALGLADFSDAIAAKPYGFDSTPDDRTVREDVLNFSRIVALREVMVRHGDGTTPLWASNWGWNNLRVDWDGDESIWGQVDERTRVNYTRAALDRAEREWPWLGGMVLHHWQPDAPPDDPIWGFALIGQDDEPTAAWDALVERFAASPNTADNGLYPPSTPYARYSGVWTFGELGADIGWLKDSHFSFDFTGRSVALLLRQDDYVGYLYPTVDGAPANALPRDAAGNAYAVLTSPSLEPALSLVSVAEHLSDTSHTLQATADRGWDQWALAGFAVSSGDLATPYNRQITVAWVTAAISLLAFAVTATRVQWAPLGLRLSAIVAPLQMPVRVALGGVASVVLMVGMLLTWGDRFPAIFRRESVNLLVAMATAGLVFLQPGVVLTLVAAGVLFFLFYHHIETGLMLTLFWAPFFLFPVELFNFFFPVAEILILLTVAAWAARHIIGWAEVFNGSRAAHAAELKLFWLDYANILWIGLGLLSLIWTAYLDPATTELRVMIIEPALFYLVWRTSAFDRDTTIKLVRTLLVAGLVVAAIGLFLYAQGTAIITAEGNARRLAGVYGSPNNVALFLGRVLPFALALVLISRNRYERLLAGLVLLVTVPTMALTQSVGALFIGLPLSIAAVLALTYRRRSLWPLVGLGIVGVVAFVVLLQFPRFARVLDFSSGTNFFRLRVWQSAINVIRDQPLTGLGLDQFLYAFRGYYIFPDAWQEPDLSHPHNVILDFWTRLGILGVLLFGGFQWGFWRGAADLYRQRTAEFAFVVGVMGGMAYLLGHGLVDNSVFVHDLVYIFILFSGIPAALQRR